jgi:Heterokaryon incompatibility protein (HET)
MSAMPATFRDAVTITRSLGCQYLWIDSLCIIQNSAEDWAQGAAQMAHIYRNSYITISADAAETCDAGIFKPRTMNFQPIHLEFNSKRRNLKGHFFVREALADWESSVNGFNSFLSSRAWCLQENMLSRRTIHFSQQQVFWSCCTKSIAESSVSPIPPPINRYGFDLDWASNKRFLLVSPSSSLTPQMLYLRWYVLVKAYVARNLTYASDIFPALSGIASAFQARLQNDTYIAGLWKNDIVRGLLWCTYDPAFTRYAKPARAPSWSWASVFNADPGFERYANPQQTPFWSWTTEVGQRNEQEIQMMVSPRVEVLRAETTLTRPSTGPFGEVEGGVLELSGPWMDATSWEDIDKFWWEWHPFGNMGNEGFISVRFDVGIDDDVQDILKERREMQKTLALLQVAKWGSGVSQVMGVLILESVGSQGVWRRRGYGEINQAEDAWLDSWSVGYFTII